MCGRPFFRNFHQIPVRVWIIAMIFITSFMHAALGTSTTYLMDYMTQQPHQKTLAVCNRKRGQQKWIERNFRDFGQRVNWTEKVQRHIHFAYFYGLAIASPLAGVFTRLLGPKTCIFWSSLFAAFTNILSGFGGKWGWIVALLSRFVVGLASGMSFPALQCFVGQWAPPNEKGKFLNAFMGSSLGTTFTRVMIYYVSSVLGWPWIFYILSSLLTVHCLIFWLLASSSPEEHKFITEEEIDYIRTTQGGTASLKKDCPPLWKILTSAECWTLNILTFGSFWGIQMELQVTPFYLEKYIGMTDEDILLLGTLPHIARFGSAVLFGNLADLIRTRNLMKMTQMSKVYVIFSHLLPGVIMMSLGSVRCNSALALILLILSHFFNGAAVGAELRNPTDLSPNFAGTIYGITLCLASTTGFIVPSLSTLILGSSPEILQWTLVFLIGGGAYFGTGIIYLWYGSAEIQRWNLKQRRNDNA